VAEVVAEFLWGCHGFYAGLVLFYGKGLRSGWGGRKSLGFLRGRGKRVLRGVWMRCFA
jgi:hypothetical protein